MAFTVEKPLTREQLEKVRAILAGNGFVLSGDSGVFDVPKSPAGRVVGTYAYVDGKLVVEVTKHRFGFGGAIKSRMEDWVEEALEEV